MIWTKSRAAVVVAAVLALTLGGSVSPAAADTWTYPGGVNCTSQNATTQTTTYNGNGTQHRAEGYSGYWYSSWAATGSAVVRSKNWGWSTILSTRLGTTGSGGTVVSAYVYCP